jgi:predicted MPP superfamily phosphohydrolase
MLMVHEPDYATYVAKHPVDLQVSGHTHGGQVRIPLIGAPILPDWGVKYPKGLYEVGNLTLYTNVGIGTVDLPVRFYCPPEITLFTLKSSSS